jgi:quercetin dioxygenase-like cupin family protein
MLRFVFAAAISLGTAPAVFAQDPTQTFPDAYQVAFENDFVKVVRVHYEAGAKFAEHTHPAGTTAYVYLNDSEGVVDFFLKKSK